MQSFFPGERQSTSVVAGFIPQHAAAAYCLHSFVMALSSTGHVVPVGIYILKYLR